MAVKIVNDSVTFFSQKTVFKRGLKKADFFE